jgi:hypothetical protein
MKTIDHIIWDHAPHEGRVSGILELVIYYHGDGHDNIIIEGTYVFQSYPLHDYVDTKFGKFSSDNMCGVSGIHLNRVGEIIYNES